MQPCSRAVRKWRENEEMNREWGNGKRMRKWRENEEIKRKLREYEEIEKKWREWGNGARDKMRVRKNFISIFPSFCRKTLIFLTFCHKALKYVTFCREIRLRWSPASCASLELITSSKPTFWDFENFCHYVYIVLCIYGIFVTLYSCVFQAKLA